jgi:glucokinase
MRPDLARKPRVLNLEPAKCEIQIKWVTASERWHNVRELVNERLYLGIEIGGTKLQVVLGNDHANIIDRRRYGVDRSAGGAGIRNQIGQAVTDFLRNHRISAVGVGFGGPVDWRSGKISCSYHVEGWSDFELGQWIGEISQAPVIVDNDANTAALAEAVKGTGQGRSPVFYMTLGSGIGGGLIVQEEIYRGAIPGEAEIGHVRLDKSGRILESRCSGWSVDQRIREAVSRNKDSVLASLVEANPGGEARHLRKAIETGDALAVEILEQTAEDLGFALSHTTHLMHPEVIIIGGGLSLMGEILREAIQRHLRRFIMDAFAPGPDVRISTLGEDVVPIGALLLARKVVSG